MKGGFSLQTVTVLPIFLVLSEIAFCISISTLQIILLSKIESQSDTESEPDDQTIEPHTLPYALTNIIHILDNFLNVLTQISSKKYLIKITLIFSEDFKLDTIALFDTCPDLNCIK